MAILSKQQNILLTYPWTSSWQKNLPINPYIQTSKFPISHNVLFLQIHLDNFLESLQILFHNQKLSKGFVIIVPDPPGLDLLVGVVLAK